MPVMKDLDTAWLRHVVLGDGPRSELLSNLAGLVDAGIPVYDALATMEKVFRKESDRRADILADIMKRLHEGKTVAEALRPWVVAHESQMLGSITRGVDLGSALRNAAGLTESRRRIVGAVTGAMAYPAVLLMVGTAMLLVFSTQVIPTLAQLIPADKWTGLGLFYHGLSSAVRHYGFLMLLAALALLAAAMLSLPRWKPGRARRWLDRRLPPYNLYQTYQGAILLITISIMMRSGIPMGDAVQILWDNNPSPWFRAHLALIRRKLEQGAGVRLAALDNPIFPVDVRIAVALFDRLSDPDKAMARLGTQAAESAEKSAKKIGIYANAAVLVLVGLLVGGVIPAVMSVVMNFYTQVTTVMRL